MKAWLALLPFVVACSSVNVQTVCEPPPVPAELLIPCFPEDDPVILPQNETMYEVYRTYVANFSGPVMRCVRKDDKLITLVKYSETFCAKMKQDNAQPKPWWKF